MDIRAHLIVLLDGQGHVVVEAQTITAVLYIATVSEP